MKEYVIQMPGAYGDWCYIIGPTGERSTYEARVFSSVAEAEEYKDKVLMTVRFRPPEYYGAHPYGVTVKERFERMAVIPVENVIGFSGKLRLIR